MKIISLVIISTLLLAVVFLAAITSTKDIGKNKNIYYDIKTPLTIKKKLILIIQIKNA